MGDLGAGLCCHQAGDAGIAKQVQHARIITPGDGFLLPGPVGGLLGEEGEMTEVGEAAVEFGLLPAQLPLFGRLAREAPVAFIILTLRIENGVGLIPQLRVFRRPPALRFRTNNEVISIALQLPAVAGIDEGVISPRFGAQGGWCVGDDHVQGHKRKARLRKEAEQQKLPACVRSCPNERVLSPAAK